MDIAGNRPRVVQGPAFVICGVTASDSPSPWGEGRDEGGCETNPILALILGRRNAATCFCPFNCAAAVQCVCPLPPIGVPRREFP